MARHARARGEAAGAAIDRSGAPRRAARRRSARRLAWLAAPPCALLTLAASWCSARRSGDAFLDARARSVLADDASGPPEPAEHGALPAALLGAAAARRVVSPATPAGRCAGERARALACWRRQLVLLASSSLCFARAARRRRSAPIPAVSGTHARTSRPATLVVALALPALALAARLPRPLSARARPRCCARRARAASAALASRALLHRRLAADGDRHRQLDRQHRPTASPATSYGRWTRRSRCSTAARRSSTSTRSTAQLWPYLARRRDGAARRARSASSRVAMAPISGARAARRSTRCCGASRAARCSRSRCSRRSSRRASS